MVKFPNMIWDAPPLFVTVHHHAGHRTVCSTSGAFFSSHVRWLLELVAELGGPGGFVPPERRFNGTFVSTFFFSEKNY